MTGITSFDGTSIDIGSFKMCDISANATNISGIGSGTAAVFANLTSMSFTSIANAQSILAAVDGMIGAIDAKRAELGAVQNRFSSTIRNQTNVIENLSAARSRMKDADFATETAALTRAQVLQQASSTILAQANQRPQSALSLLQG